METGIRAIDNFFIQPAEPLKSSLEYLRYFLNHYNPDVTEEWKYRLPFYYFKGKMFCYLWIDKNSQHPYIGIVEGGKIDHPMLVAGDRKRMKVMYIDPLQDIPVKDIKEVLDMAVKHYK
ncbi:MAG: DUF1801 domain-containing protein [Bacteroidota bacterium]